MSDDPANQQPDMAGTGKVAARPSVGKHVPVSRVTVRPMFGMRDEVIAAMTGRAKLNEQAQQMGASAFRDQMKLSDLLTPRFARHAGLVVSSQLSESLRAAAGLQSWRTSLLAADVGRRLAPDIGRLTVTTTHLTRWATDISASATVMRGISLPAMKAYSDYLADTPTRVKLASDAMPVLAGHAVNGLVGTELLTGELTDAQLREAGLNVESDVLKPWRAGPGQARDELLQVLAGLDPVIPELLHGAWDDVQRRGPAAVTKIANCAVEAVDRAIRAGAPDSEVLAWLETQSAPRGLVGENGRPARAARVRYLLRERPGDRELVGAQVDALVALQGGLTSRLQAAKHNSATALVAVRSHLYSAEALLHQLFACEIDLD